MPDSAVAITAGTGTNIDTITNSGGDHRQVVIIGNKGSHEGFCSTFRTLGLAGSVGQKLFSIHNATGSSVVVDVKSIQVFHLETVAKAVTVLTPTVRLYKVTVLPSTGDAVTKVARDSGATATSASVTVRLGSSGDGVNSTTALAATLPTAAVIYGAPAPRLITGAGHQEPQGLELIPKGSSVVLRALEGVVVFLEYTTATWNPVTDVWWASCNWEEYAP